MNRPQAVALCRLAKACCPQQTFDEYTPDAWFELLGDLRFDDAKQALLECAKASPFVAPAEIRAGVRRIRYNRLDKFGKIAPPDLDDMHAEQEWLNAVYRRAADGDLTRAEFDREQKALGHTGAHQMPALEGVFHSADE